MLALLYCKTREIGHAQRATADFDERIVIRNGSAFRGDIELKIGATPVDRVYVTESCMRCMGPYMKVGLPVDVLADGPEPVPTLPDLSHGDDPELPPGYWVQHKGSWWTAYRKNGDKAGPAQRAKEEAEQIAWGDYMEMTSGGND